MLSDHVRNISYKRALDSTIKRNNVVLDLGCGSEFYPFFLAMAKAKRVYAVDFANIIELGKIISNKNGFDNKIVFINQHSEKINLEEKLDLIVSETIGNFVLEKGIIGSIIDMRDRYLKKDGKIITKSIELVAVPVESRKIYKTHNIWKDNLYGINFSYARSLSINNPDWVELISKSLLSIPKIIHKINLLKVNETKFLSKTSFKSIRNRIEEKRP